MLAWFVWVVLDALVLLLGACEQTGLAEVHDRSGRTRVACTGSSDECAKNVFAEELCPEGAHSVYGLLHGRMDANALRVFRSGEPWSIADLL